MPVSPAGRLQSQLSTQKKGLSPPRRSDSPQAQLTNLCPLVALTPRLARLSARKSPHRSPQHSLCLPRPLGPQDVHRRALDPLADDLLPDPDGLALVERREAVQRQEAAREEQALDGWRVDAREERDRGRGGGEGVDGRGEGGGGGGGREGERDDGELQQGVQGREGSGGAGRGGEQLREDGGRRDGQGRVRFGRGRRARIGHDGRRRRGAAAPDGQRRRCEDLVVLVEEDERVQLESLDELEGVMRVAAWSERDDA